MRFDDDDDSLPAIHPAVLASDQVADAILHLEQNPAVSLCWPWPALDELTGPMNRGEVWFVVAFSGGGKTTFITSAIDRWVMQGKRVYVMPLELKPDTFRTYIACYHRQVHPGDAISLKLRTMPDGAAKRDAVIAALQEQHKSPWVERFMVSGQRSINVAGLKRGLQEAKAFGADVVIVDHIDHISGGDGSNLFSESKDVNHRALEMAQANDLLLVFTSQLNLNISRNPDHLAKYSPPRVDHVFMPSIKLQVATGMIGLFRKVRDPRPHETVDEYQDALRRARRGDLEAPEVLDHHVMGVNAMKLRHYGAHEGKRVYLGFENGRVTPLEEKDRWTTTNGYPRPVV